MEPIKENVLKIINATIRESKENHIEILLEQEKQDLLQLGMDSITFIQIIVALEEAFDIIIPDEKLLLTEMGTVNKMAEVVSIAFYNKKST